MGDVLIGFRFGLGLVGALAVAFVAATILQTAITLAEPAWQWTFNLARSLPWWWTAPQKGQIWEAPFGATLTVVSVLPGGGVWLQASATHWGISDFQRYVREHRLFLLGGGLDG